MDSHYRDRALGLGNERPYDRYDSGTFSEARVLHYPRQRSRFAALLGWTVYCNCGATWASCPDRPRP